VIAVLASLVVLSGPVAGKLIRRSNSLAAYSTIRQTFAAARLQAIKRVTNVVVEASLTTDGRLRLRTFQDRANDETTPQPADEAAAAGNFVQDTGSFASSPATDEPILAEVTLDSGVRIWKRGGTKEDLTDGVAFDTYHDDSAVVDRVAFLPSGGIVTPEAANSGVACASGGRGIYFADAAGMNFFRVSVDSDFSGKLRVDKYVDGDGYQPRNWTWK
jgi:hypothetical protein